MSVEEIKEYLRQNLSINLSIDYKNDNENIVVSLYLEKELISESYEILH